MEAAVLYGSRDIRVEKRSEPVLSPGEVRVQIEAALTCGTDLKVFKRGYHARMLVPPCIFGHELSGVIIETHEAAGWNAGDRVVVANSAPCGECFYCKHHQENLCDDLLFFNGAYAERAVIPRRIVEKNMLSFSSTTSFEAAALTEPLACVVQGVQDLELQKGETVLVIGSGPIGLMFTRLAAELGCHIVMSGRGEERLKTARKLGAAEIIDTRNSTLDETRKFDAVFEAVGSPQTWEQSVRCARKGGRVNFFGGCPSGTSVQLDTGLLHYSSLRLLASFHHTPATVREALKQIESGAIQAEDFISGRCQLADLPQLFQRMAEGNRAIKTLVKT